MFKEITKKETVTFMVKWQTKRDFERKVLLEDDLTRMKSRGSSALAKKELQAVEKTLSESQSFIRLA